MNNTKRVSKITDSLIFKFGILFFIHACITILLIGFAAYFFQFRQYTSQLKHEINNAADYLGIILSDKTIDFKDHQQYLMEH
ncbi:MAG: hypothetical protein K6A23_14390, partial [Butyrivibrio sp.]|nr:hypothetical protein [Butyrivibrio sp.]